MAVFTKFLTLIVIAVMTVGCASSPTEPAEQSVRVGKVQQIIYQQVEKKPALVTVLTGAALGGVVGNQFGGGSGKTVATGLGVLGGAVATDKSLSKKYNQVVYKVYLPSEQAVVGVVSGDLAATIFKNDIVVIYKSDKKVTIDAYGEYSEAKYDRVLQKLADGTLE
ncbi:glycine zipper 2TM domain-containing protein [Neiella holothuriorum]|nr:glycine zipper 2TM domain-containing protein [Neiella holothuriorum]